MHKQYQKQGVVFIGLTTHDEFALDTMKEHLDTLGVEWLNGYGADKTLLELQAFSVPSVWVIGPDGRIVWNFDSRESMEEGIEKALTAVE